MTQLEPQPYLESQYTDQYGGEQRTSPLAIGSLISSLVCCCPITTILGVILGIGALVSISGNPLLKGRGLAIAGIVLGAIFTIISIPAWVQGGRFLTQMSALLQSGPQDALEAGFAGDYAGFRARMHGPAAAATDAEAEAFIAELRSRYGEFISAEIVGEPDIRMGDPTTTGLYRLTFENAEVEAHVEIALFDEAAGRLVLSVTDIEVRDAELGDIRFPLSAP